MKQQQQSTKDLIKKISQSLKLRTIELIIANGNEEESVESANKLIDIIISSHLTSMFSCMTMVANMCDGEEPKEAVSKFINDIKEFLNQCDALKKAKIVYE